jgi:integrase
MPNKKNSKGARGDGYIHQRKDGRWEGVAYVGRDPKTGRQKRKSVYGKTQNEVRLKLRKITTELDGGSYTEPSKLTVGRWMDIWTADYLGGIDWKTKETYINNTENHVKPHLGNIMLAELCPEDVQSFINHLSERGRIIQSGQTKIKSAGLAPKTVQNIQRMLHKALKQALLLKYIKSNPADSGKNAPVVLPPLEKKEMQYLQGKEIQDFSDACEKIIKSKSRASKYGILYMVDSLIGVRRGEVLGITWDCVEPDKGTIYINKQLQKPEGVYAFEPPKYNEIRHVHPPSTVFRLLEEQKERQEEMKRRAGASWSNDMNLVFTNETGGGLDGDNVYKRYKNFLAKYNLPNIRFHDLRHTAATQMLDSEVNVLAISKELGHKDVAFTLKQYGHITDDAWKESAARREAQFQRVMGQGAKQNL